MLTKHVAAEPLRKYAVVAKLIREQNGIKEISRRAGTFPAAHEAHIELCPNQGFIVLVRKQTKQKRIVRSGRMPGTTCGGRTGNLSSVT